MNGKNIPAQAKIKKILIGMKMTLIMTTELFFSFFILFFSANFKYILYILVIMKVLFICNQNENRSLTAEELFKDRFKTRSAGLYNENPVTEDEIVWADTIFVMEDFQRKVISERFPKQYMQKRIISLDIPDIYNHDSSELKDILEQRVKECLSTIVQTA